MSIQPTISGTLIQIAPTIQVDREHLFEVASDPLIWEQHPSRDRWQRTVFDKFFDDGIATGGALTVRELNSKLVIGSSRYYAWDPVERHISIGATYLARRYWGGTYNRELKRLMLENAFTFVEKVWFHIGVNNIRSRLAIAAIGGKFSHEVNDDPSFNRQATAYYYIERQSWIT